MATTKADDSNKQSNINSRYFIVVTVLTFLLPAAGFMAEHFINSTPLSFERFARWFIFSAVGLRLFLAGIKQTTDPAFTAKEIFHISGTESHPVVRELGFANLCFGLLGIASLFKPEWRTASAFASGLYYGMAGLLHLIKKPAGTNEKFALVTDVIIFLFLLAYLLTSL